MNLGVVICEVATATRISGCAVNGQSGTSLDF
jgi:hypothetical protein